MGRFDIRAHLRDEPIPIEDRAYFRQRVRNQLHQALLRELSRQEKAGLVTRATLAARLGWSEKRLLRFIGGAGAWNLGAASDIYVALGGELAADFRPLPEPTP